MSSATDVPGGRNIVVGVSCPPNNAENPCASCPDKDKRIAELEALVAEYERRLSNWAHDANEATCEHRFELVSVVQGSTAGPEESTFRCVKCGAGYTVSITR
jgi:hypothetical protein